MVRSSSRVISSTVAVSAFLASCGQQQHSQDPTPPPTPPPGITWKACITQDHPVGDPDGNGTQLLGVGFRRLKSSADTKKYFIGVTRIDPSNILGAAGQRISSVTWHNHELTGTLPDGNAVNGKAWEGAALSARVLCRDFVTEYPVTLRIAQVEPWDRKIANLGGSEPPPWQFKLDLELPDARIPACEEPVGENIALPVPGRWDVYGKYVEQSNDSAFNFACRDHIVAKCLREGYPIHSDDAGKKTLFHACTRMMRADYCAKGVPLTFDGTLITLRDTAGISSPPVPDPRQRSFEAAWTSGEIFCFGHLRNKFTEQLEQYATCALHPRQTCVTEDQARALPGGTSKPLIFSYSAVPKASDPVVGQ